MNLEKFELKTMPSIDALIDIFDFIELKMKKFRDTEITCERYISFHEQGIKDTMEFWKDENDRQEKIAYHKDSIDIWDYRKNVASKNYQNLYKVKRKIQEMFKNGELEK